MKGDFSREPKNLNKGYSAVRMQQGRVQLDSDWNEQVELELKRQRQILIDVIGKDGMPLAGNVADLSFLGIQLFVVANTTVFIFSYYALDESRVGFRAYIGGNIVEQEFPSIPVTIEPVAATIDYYTINLSRMTYSDGREIAVGDNVVLAISDGAVSLDPRRSSLNPILTVDPATRTATIKKTDPAAVITSRLNGRLALLYGYRDQPYYINPPALSATTKYLAYLEVWRRHVTAVEDPNLREVALGGVDTSTRAQPIWQLKAIPFDDSELPTLNDGSWVNRVKLPPPSSLSARYVPAPGQAQALENRLYRVEIHQGGRLASGDKVTFKWSRDNGSQLAAWTGGNGPINVATQGRDEALGFTKGQWIELSCDEREFKCEPGTFVQIADVPTAIDGGLSLKLTAPAGADTTFANYLGHPKARRWDGTAATYPLSVVPAAPGGFIALENGIEVQFDQDATFVEGDYWLIPVRSNIGGIEWPQVAGQPLAQTALRNEHHYLALNTFQIGTDNRKLNRHHFLGLANIGRALVNSSSKTISIFPAFSPVQRTVGTLSAWQTVTDSATGQMYAVANSMADYTTGVAPVQFPEKATIEELGVFWEISGTTTDVRVSLYVSAPQIGIPANIITVYGRTGTGGAVVLASETTNFRIPSEGVYFVHVSAPPATPVKIVSVYIKYRNALLNDLDILI
jgi:hypothetical protein